jgi:hypothetical protein
MMVLVLVLVVARDGGKLVVRHRRAPLILAVRHRGALCIRLIGLLLVLLLMLLLPLVGPLVSDIASWPR